MEVREVEEMKRSGCKVNIGEGMKSSSQSQ